MELRPLPLVRRNALPRWAVYLDGQRIGEVHMKKLRGARNGFYEAIVPHPVTGKPLSLELDTSLDDRVRAIVAFHHDPNSAAQHWR